MTFVEFHDIDINLELKFIRVENSCCFQKIVRYTVIENFYQFFWEILGNIWLSKLDQVKLKAFL